MKSSFPFLMAVLKGSDARLLLRIPVAGSPATLPRGIGGRSPSSDFLGQWRHCPCWPRPTQRTISTINNQTKERKNMHNSKIKTHHFKNQTLQPISYGIIHFRTPALRRLVRRDETLWQAEVHLREAIQALKESSQAIKSAL